jgi:hypothetical protein
MDLIDRQAAIDATWFEPSYTDPLNVLTEVRDKLKVLPSVQPEQKTCEGCKHSGQWENELEYGASCPCLVCKRRASDNYERFD